MGACGMRFPALYTYTLTRRTEQKHAHTLGSNRCHKIHDPISSIQSDNSIVLRPLELRLLTSFLSSGLLLAFSDHVFGR